MKHLFLLLSFFAIATTQAQTQDTLFVWKAGVLVHKQSIKPADMDSITFKRPVTTNPLGITTAAIPAGTFVMGSPTTETNRVSDETQHTCICTLWQSVQVRHQVFHQILVSQTQIHLGIVKDMQHAPLNPWVDQQPIGPIALMLTHWFSSLEVHIQPWRHPQGVKELPIWEKSAQEKPPPALEFGGFGAHTEPQK